jgi:hypothetical protein
MRIDSAGKVGIGTSVMNKEVNFAGATQGEQNKLHFEAETDSWSIYSYDRTNGHYCDLHFGQHFHAKTGGNHGIGTVSPDKQLHISAGAGGGSLRFENTGTALDGNANGVLGVIEFEGQDATTNASGVRASITGGTQNTSGGAYLGFSTGNSATANAEKMRIQANGYVGIGCTPSDLLHLQSTTSNEATIRIGHKVAQAINTGPDIQFYNAVQNDGVNQYEAGRIAIRKSNGTTNNHDHYMAFSTRKNSVEGLYEAMRIDSAGNVGIGITVPESHNVANAFHIGSDYELGFGDGANSRPDFGIVATGSGGSALLNIYAGEGSDTIDAYMDTGGVLNIDVTDTSDISLKENIVSLEDGLNAVMALNPVSFDWKSEGKGSNTGFIAQEVEDITSLANDVQGVDGMKGINVTGIVAHLTKAIQELSAKVTALENA